MIRPILLFLLIGVITAAGTVYVQRDRALPALATLIVRQITGVETLRIGAVTALPADRALILTDIQITPEQTLQTLRLTPDLITLTDATLRVQITQEDKSWYAALPNTDLKTQLYPLAGPTPAFPLPTIVLNNVTIIADTPQGTVNARVNGQYGQGAWVGEVVAEAISLRHEDTVINGLNATISAAADTGWTTDFTIATLTQGQTPFTALQGRAHNLTTAPHLTLRGVLNTEFAFDAKADLGLDGKVKSVIRILTTAEDVGHITLTTDWKTGDQATLDITNLSLRTLPTLTGWQGLTADGRLSGRFALTRAAQGWIIKDGHLQGGAGGFIAYTPDIYPGFLASDDPRLSAVRDILKHLNINDITVNASGDLADQMRLGIALKGINPDYSPRPVHLNLNFEGTMWPLAQSLLRPLTLIPNIKPEKDTPP